MMNLGGRVDESLRKAILPANKKTMSKGVFIKKVAKQAGEDAKKAGGDVITAKRIMKRLATAAATGAALPGSTRQRRKFVEVMQEGKLVKTTFKSKGAVIRAYETLQHAHDEAEEEKSNPEGASGLSAAEQRKEEAHERERMWALARERRREDNEKKGVSVVGSAGGYVRGKAEEAAEQQKERGEGDVSPKAAVDMMID
ncbi:MAG: hypothetical protein WC822_05240 [Candidatus Paceibacterota bacterium]|jgi:hypothetical protein